MIPSLDSYITDQSIGDKNRNDYEHSSRCLVEFPYYIYKRADTDSISDGYISILRNLLSYLNCSFMDLRVFRIRFRNTFIFKK